MPEPAENYRGGEIRGRLHHQAINVAAITITILLAWNLLFVLAPILSAEPLYSFFSYICHQIPERSFNVFGGPMAVCSRCFGIYFGLLLGATAYTFWRGVDDLEPLSKVWLFIGMVPVGIDWSLTAFGIWENTPVSRVLTGAILGVVCAIYIVPSIIEIVRNFVRVRRK